MESKDNAMQQVGQDCLNYEFNLQKISSPQDQVGLLNFPVGSSKQTRETNTFRI